MEMEGKDDYNFSVEIFNKDNLRTLYSAIVNSQSNLKQLKGEWGLYLYAKYGFMFPTDITILDLFHLEDNIGRKPENPVLITPSSFLSCMLVNILDFTLFFDDGKPRSFKFNSCNPRTKALEFLRSQPELELQQNDDVLIGGDPVSAQMLMKDLLAKNCKLKLSIRKSQLISKTFCFLYYLIFHSYAQEGNRA